VRLCYLEFPGREVLFISYIAVVGFLTGFQFPVAATAYRMARRSAPRTAAVLDAADNLGAALGGLLTGVFLIPVYGFALPVVLFAEIKMMTFAWQEITRSRRPGDE
jgi:predicted membrane-bound spermidine synthase